MGRLREIMTGYLRGPDPLVSTPRGVPDSDCSTTRKRFGERGGHNIDCLFGVQAPILFNHHTTVKSTTISKSCGSMYLATNARVHYV